MSDLLPHGAGHCGAASLIQPGMATIIDPTSHPPTAGTRQYQSIPRNDSTAATYPKTRVIRIIATSKWLPDRNETITKSHSAVASAGTERVHHTDTDTWSRADNGEFAGPIKPRATCIWTATRRQAAAVSFDPSRTPTVPVIVTLAPNGYLPGWIRQHNRPGLCVPIQIPSTSVVLRRIPAHEPPQKSDIHPMPSLSPDAGLSLRVSAIGVCRVFCVLARCGTLWPLVSRARARGITCQRTGVDCTPA